MHLEILVEDQSGKILLEAVIPKLLVDGHTFTVHAYKGIGRIPKDLVGKADPTKRILLSLLPKLCGDTAKHFRVTLKIIAPACLWCVILTTDAARNSRTNCSIY
jgi:hypothetical protein